MEDEETDSPPPPPPTGNDLKEDFDDQKEAAIPHQTPRTPSPPATGNDSKEEVDNQKEAAVPHHRTPATKAPPAAVPTPFVTQTFLEGEEENFMTLSPKEKAAWIKMIKTRHASLVKKEQEHKKWKDSMMERRVTVYNRSKKLLSAQRDRFRFLFKMAEVVKQLSDNKADENGGDDEDDKDKENDGVVNDNGNDDNNADNVDGVINTNNNTDDNKSAENDDENVQRLDAVPTILVNGPTQ